MIISNHCPFVVMLKPEISRLAAEYQQLGIGVVAISSNSVKTHPQVRSIPSRQLNRWCRDHYNATATVTPIPRAVQDGPDEMAKDSVEFKYTFPYLYDESQDVAKAYKAMCTPEFYCFDADMKLVYHGQFDDARMPPLAHV